MTHTFIHIFQGGAIARIRYQDQGSWFKAGPVKILRGGECIADQEEALWIGYRVQTLQEL